MAALIVGILVAFISRMLFLSEDALIEIYDDLKVQHVPRKLSPLLKFNLSLNLMKFHVLLRIN